MNIRFRWLVIVTVCLSLVTSFWVMIPRSSAQTATWTVNVFNNKDLAGSPVWVGVTSSINYNWGADAPTINGQATGAPADNFSIRFTSSVLFTAGTYRFTVQVDDGARLYVDGFLVINSWQNGEARTIQGDYTFTSDAYHTIMVEMYDVVDKAVIVASWALSSGGMITPVGTGTPWLGEFFPNADLSGAPVFTTNYPPSGLNINWGQASPAGNVPVDAFSARIIRSLGVPTDVPKGIYKFYVRADDNFRFYVDSTLILDNWGVYSGGQLYTADVTLLEGPHTIRLEYRDQSADAYVFLTWTPPSGQNPILNLDGGGGVVSGTPVPTIAPMTPPPGATAVPQAPPPPPPSNAIGRVQGNLVIRDAPNRQGAKIGLMPWKTEVPILGRDQYHAWYQVNYNGLVGWAYAPWIKLIQGAFDDLPYTDGSIPVWAPPPTEGVIVQCYGNVKIRSGPGLNFPRISKVTWGTRVQVLGISPDRRWYQIRHGDVIGWSSAPWYRLVQGDLASVPVVSG